MHIIQSSSSSMTGNSKEEANVRTRSSLSRNGGGSNRNSGIPFDGNRSSTVQSMKTVYVQVKPLNKCSVFHAYLKLRQQKPCGDITDCPPGDQIRSVDLHAEEVVSVKDEIRMLRITEVCSTRRSGENAGAHRMLIVGVAA